jgi:hypothetical protein
VLIERRRLATSARGRNVLVPITIASASAALVGLAIKRRDKAA